MAKKVHRPRGSGPDEIYIGERIREARLERGMSQSALAEQLDVTFQQVQKYEKGVNRVGGSRMNQLANALNKPVQWFFPGSDTARGTIDPVMSKFISTKEGHLIASRFHMLKPSTRTIVLDLIQHLSRSTTNA